MRVLHLLATRLLADLPDDLRDAARGTPAAHEPDRRITDLDLTGDVQDLNLGVEVAGRTKSGVLLVHHHVARARHVLLVETLNVHADVVTGARLILALVVHLHSEDLARARVRGRVGRQEHHLLTRLHAALLHAARNNVAHTLDLVDPPHGQTHRGVQRPHGRARHVVE